MHSSQELSLRERTRGLVDRIWRGSVNWAARDLGVPQSSLQRVVDGTITSPRTHFAEAFRVGLGVSTDWLIAGVGISPGDFDEAGLPLVAGVPRWRRTVAGLTLDDSLAEHVRELPYSVWRASTVLSRAQGKEPSEVAKESLTQSLEAWSNVFEALSAPKVTDLRDALRKCPELVRLGFSAGPTSSASSRGSKSFYQQLFRELDAARRG